MINDSVGLYGFIQGGLTVWLRNARVWGKLIGPSLMGNFGEPLLYLLVLGYGLGQFVGEVEGLPYMVFLASGVLGTSAVNSATFEGLYSAYTRMEVQQTWHGMMSAPLSIAEIVFGEILWAATKSLISVAAILLVASALGLVHDFGALLIIPVTFITGCCFAAIALVVTSSARSYDYFLYYTTLFITPMVLLSGVFFPLSSLPHGVQILAKILPLYHGVEIVRPLMTGQTPDGSIGHLLVLIAYGCLGAVIAVKRIEKRLIR